MKVALFLILAIGITSVSAEYDTPWEYFFYGLKFCVEAFFQDITSPTKFKQLDAYKTVAEIIITAGYRFEEHKILASDGYINTAWRIVGKLNSTIREPRPETKPCVILQHGLVDNSATWLIPNKTIALPFTLVDEGYDVWMTNSRGNINSYEHMHPETHNVKDISSDYFKFTWDEMAKYDLPSNIDYVLSHSNHKKVFYVGHSQGTTQFFAAADIIPGLEDKIAAFIGLAPVMYVGNIISPFIWIQIKIGIAKVLDWLKIYNFLIFPNEISPLLREFAIQFPRLLWRLLGLIMGIDEIIRIDLSRIPVMQNHEPGGTSYFNMNHWIQSIEKGEFQMYDFGSKAENIIHYGQPTAPLYNTTHIADTFF